jgi:hypothetical protein
MWKALEEHLNSGDDAHAKMALLYKLFHLTPVAGEPIRNYLTKVLQIRNDMAEMHPGSLTDNVIKMMITRYLPEQYSSCTHYMNSQKPSATLEQFNAALVQFEAQNSLGTFAPPAAAQAHEVTTSQDSASTTSPITLPAPHWVGCGKPGH